MTTQQKYACISYRVHPDEADANATSVQRVLADLATHSGEVGYMVRRSGPHGEAFEHIVWGDRTTLIELPAFQDFQASLLRRLDGDLHRAEGTILGMHHPPAAHPGPDETA